MTVIVAAKVWTYWMAPILFVAAVVLDLTIAVLYVKRFVLPRLVVTLIENDRPVQRPVELRPRRQADERRPASSAA
jgi:hypothetical protein